MSYYKHHVFFCTNQREPGQVCCAARGGIEMRDYAKDRIKALELNQGGPGNWVRINSAGCFGRCDEGPVIVVYPEEIWYTYFDKDDIDEIIDSHLINGKIVDRLRI